MAVEFFSTGSTLLNLALGGGWARGRVFNIVGDKSSGKTLLAIEAFANFSREIPGAMRYVEAEAAFDVEYAITLGFPAGVTRVDPEKPVKTVEAFFDDLSDFVKGKKGEPGLYILDSLDALSDEAELERDIRKGSFGASKAKKLSETFRRIVKDLGATDTTVGVISQIRDNIDAMFGDGYTRSGGHALDFYASQILWLAEIGKIKRTVKGFDKVVGVDVRAKAKKIKVGIPFREVDIQVLLGYGVDDEASNIQYLKDAGEFDKKQFEEAKSTLAKARKDGEVEFLRKTFAPPLAEQVTKIWKEIEAKIAPGVSKYS